MFQMVMKTQAASIKKAAKDQEQRELKMKALNYWDDFRERRRIFTETYSRVKAEQNRAMQFALAAFVRKFFVTLKKIFVSTRD